MNPDELKVILENAETSLDDKLKAIQDLHEAAAKGLILKRDELIAAEKKLKDNLKSLEEKATASTAKITELEAEMKKNNPEDRQKYYDAKLLELEKNYNALKEPEGRALRRTSSLGQANTRYSFSNFSSSRYTLNPCRSCIKAYCA